MLIYLLRHGIAETGRPGQPDSVRVLTAEGRRKLKDVLRTARAAGASPDVILTSPYKRAVETAEIAAEILGCREAPRETTCLVPGASPSGVWDEIRPCKDLAGVLLVGHQPLFGFLAAYLLQSPDLSIDFKKGALACIGIESFGAQPKGVLHWLLIPKLAAG